jgi:uridine kinase
MTTRAEIKVQFTDGRKATVDEGTVVGTLTKGPTAPDGLPYIAALVNNDASSLSYPLTVNSQVEFLTMADAHGWRIYRRSLCFLLAKTVRELYPEADFAVEHSFGLGLYCSFNFNGNGENVTRKQTRSIEARMKELVAADQEIIRRKISFADTVDRFQEEGQWDKLNLLKYRNPPSVVVHWCDGFSDIAHGPLAPSTGVLQWFALLPYGPGMVLHLPTRANPTELEEFEDQPHLFQIFREHKGWGRILGVSTVGALNEINARNGLADFIRTAEALHEKKLSRIADRLAENHEQIRVVLVAGPSCAGKTTFAKRLSTHCRVNGLRLVTLSTDDYFVGEERNPVDEEGKPDYEHVEAVDIDLFNKQLLQLIEGKEIELPRFNFETKQREYRGERLKIEKDQIIVVEGIHGLNPRVSHMVPVERKFRIYVNALTQLNLDANNRISTTDNRLMRRIVRDHRYRGHSALETLRLWPSVRRGEKRWIFPFQREADVTFNSALDYELAILKPRVEPFLMEVKPYDREYSEARRLSEFLLNFLGASSRHVPNHSILREYIGGSTFEY